MMKGGRGGDVGGRKKGRLVGERWGEEAKGDREREEKNRVI